MLAVAVCVLFVLILYTASTIVAAPRAVPADAATQERLSRPAPPSSWGAAEGQKAPGQQSLPTQTHEEHTPSEVPGRDVSPTIHTHDTPATPTAAAHGDAQAPIVSETALRRVRGAAMGTTESLPLEGCDATVQRDTAITGGLHQRAQALLASGGMWPSFGPATGGGEVFVKPRTSAARQHGQVQCAFGIARAQAGYDALYDLVVCTSPPQQHTVGAGDTLASIAAAHGISLSDLTMRNIELSRRTQGLRIGDHVLLNADDVSVTLTDNTGGKPLLGEDVHTYRYTDVRVTDVSPKSVSTAGGQVVTLRGAFVSLSGSGAGQAAPCPLRCRFGSSSTVAGYRVSQDEVRCIAPVLPTDALDAGPAAAGGVVARSVAVFVSTNGADFTTHRDARAGMVAYTRDVLCVHQLARDRSKRGRAAAEDGGAGAGQGPPVKVAVVSVPKAFVGPEGASGAGAVGRAQHAALKSWASLRPRVEILLASGDAGVAEAAAEHRALHLANVKVNDLGTPLLDSILREAVSATSADVLVLVNADILLFDDLLPVVQQAARAFDEFFIVGRRSNLNATLTAAAQQTTGAAARRRLRQLVHAVSPHNTRCALARLALRRGRRACDMCVSHAGGRWITSPCLAAFCSSSPWPLAGGWGLLRATGAVGRWRCRLLRLDVPGMTTGWCAMWWHAGYPSLTRRRCPSRISCVSRAPTRIPGVPFGPQVLSRTSRAHVWTPFVGARRTRAVLARPTGGGCRTPARLSV